MSSGAKEATGLPVFLGVGPARSGTTWLHRALTGRVNLPARVKETNFFDSHYEKGMKWYLSHFRKADPKLPIGEICCYFEVAKARERIARHMPNCRIIVSLRDPVERTYSYYKLMRKMVWTRATFDEVVKTRPHVNAVNRYAFHLGDWYARLGRDNVLVCFYDDLRRDPQSYLDQICDFIGIPQIAIASINGTDDSVNAIERAPKNRRLAHNARHLLGSLKAHRAYRTVNFLSDVGVWNFCFGRGERFPNLSLEQEMQLRELYLPEIEALEQLLERDLTNWKNPRVRRQAPAA